MLRIENQENTFKYEMSGGDKELVSELVEIGGLVLAAVMRGNEKALVSKASLELVLVRAADAVAADMVKMAMYALENGVLPEEKNHGEE